MASAMISGMGSGIDTEVTMLLRTALAAQDAMAAIRSRLVDAMAQKEALTAQLAEVTSECDGLMRSLEESTRTASLAMGRVIPLPSSPLPVTSAHPVETVKKGRKPVSPATRDKIKASWTPERRAAASARAKEFHEARKTAAAGATEASATEE